MKEEYLHYLWKFRLFDHNDLRTTTGDSIEVLRPGTHNTDSGPDFHEALIRIGTTTWAGNVEIHVKASDWIEHRHSEDPAYHNVILHVIWFDDADICYPSGNKIPALCLQNRADTGRFIMLEQWNQNSHSIPCASSVANVSPVVMQGTIERMLITRLEAKTKQLSLWHTELKGDWEEIFYRTLLQNFGFRINSMAFGELATRIPYRILRKHRHNGHEVESLLFGASGLAKNLKDDYARKLEKTFKPLATKWNLIPMTAQSWKFMRTRPVNFPTIRIAQVTALILRHESLFSVFTEISSPEDCSKILSAPLSPYWNEHYRFGDYGQVKRKQAGHIAAANIVINTIAPMLFIYGKITSRENYVERSLHLLEITAPEENNVTRRWKKCGVQIQSAFESQGLIQLYRSFCLEKKCLTCSIGSSLLRNS